MPHSIFLCPLPPEEVFRRIARNDGAFYLDSALPGAPGNRWSILGCSPEETLQIRLEESDDALETLRSFLHEMPTASSPISSCLPLAAPVSIALLGYGLRTHIEPTLCESSPPDPEIDLPDLHVARHDEVLVHDATTNTWYRSGTRRGANWWNDRLDENNPIAQPTPLAPRLDSQESPRPLLSSHDPAEYESAVRRALEHIASGDFYQVNLSRRLRTQWSGHPADLYQQLRNSNPAPFAAYLDLGNGRTILSTSPERFLRLEEGRVETRPIKGTRPRRQTLSEDRQMGFELLGSEKDRAELGMIVDVLRNDLGRVCETGTIRVEQHAQLESYPAVHHLVSTVTGRLREGAQAVDLLRATFPGGSITGAPKIRAMEFIDEIEPYRRGPYTGSIGWFDARGNMDMNILIRTAIRHGEQIAFHVGGGIVADSRPHDEFIETVAKAGGIQEVLSGSSGSQTCGQSTTRSNLVAHR